MSTASSILGFYGGGHLPDHSHVHLLYQHLELDHRRLDIPDAGTNDLALAAADEEKIATDTYFLHWSCVSRSHASSRGNLTDLRTCVVSSLRLTVVLGHGNPDFTWYYVPLGAYSVFEPLGGILCTNLPIIWHMWRKRKGGLPQYNSASKPTFSDGHTPTIGSTSRRSRLAIALGLTSHDRTQNGSRLQTNADIADTTRGAWDELDSMDHIAPPDPKIWTTIEVEEDGPSEPPAPGMKKTVWNVRRAALEPSAARTDG